MSSAGGWSFDDLVEDDYQKAGAESDSHDTPDGSEEEVEQKTPPFPTTSTPPPEEPQPPTDAPPSHEGHYPSRTCRICLEEIFPTFEPASEGMTAMFNPRPKVTYISSDPASGRLIRPCKCRGSQQYVHEGCLQEWRHADPSYGRRTYFECPTCKFQYRLERIKWSRWLTSTTLQIFITFAIMLTTIFLFGFVADPIINLYLDPLDTITTTATGGRLPAIALEEDAVSWGEHFVKGLASLGLLGFVKVFFAMSPWHWWNLRQAGVIGGGTRRARGRQGGRERLENISWTVVVIGVITFLFVSYLILSLSPLLIRCRLFGHGSEPGP